MPDPAALVRPLVLSFYHRLRPRELGKNVRAAVTIGLAAAGYGLFFSFLTRLYWQFFATVQGVSSLKGFAPASSAGLTVRVAGLGIALGLGALFVVTVAGSAARSLDPSRDGADLGLLLTQPVDPGGVVLSRAVAAALLDPLGLVLLGPPMAALAAVESGAGLTAGAVLALPAYLGLRTAVQAAALTLILVNRAALPRSLRAEPFAVVEAASAGAALLVSTGIEPARIASSFHDAATLVEPLASLTARTASLVPAPLLRLLEAMPLVDAGAVLIGWGSLLGVLVVCRWLASRLPPHLLAAQTRRSTSARALGGAWELLWPSCRRPAEAILLKDLVTAWRANLTMAPALVVLIPATAWALHTWREWLSSVPVGALLAPVLILASTAASVTLCELAEGTEAPPLPFSSGRLAALKAAASATITVVISELALFSAYPASRALEALPWVAVAGSLMSVLLAELLSFAPGSAAEVFTPAGIRTAVLWSLCAVGLASLTGVAPASSRLATAALGLSMARALWGAEELLRHDLSVRDIVVMLGFFRFGSEAVMLAAGFASSFVDSVWLGLAATLAVQAGLGWMTLDYLRRAGAAGGADLAEALGLPAARPVRRALAAALAGLGVAALFGSLGGLRLGETEAVGINLAGFARMVLAGAVAPLVEECFFRATVQRALSRAFGRPAGLLLASVLFAAAHPGPPSVTLMALGLVLGLLYERSGSVYEPAIAHMAFNHSQAVIVALGAELTRAVAP